MDDQPVDKIETASEPDTYEPPRIESVMTSEDLAREIQYAGISSSPP